MGSFSEIMQSRYSLACVLIIACIVLTPAFGEGQDLQSLSSAQLAEVERATLADVQESEKRLASLKAETDTLRAEERSITEQADKLQGAKNWEEEEKRKKEKELDEAKQDVQLKQENIARTSQRVNELKDRIAKLQSLLRNLSAEKDVTARRFQKPSLKDVFDSRSQQWGDVSRNVYNKTLTNLIPVFSEMSATARQYKNRVSNTSPILGFLASILLYSFLIGAAFTIHKIYSKVRGHLTISRLLFLGDAFCACFWFLMLLCFCFLWTDPLIVIQGRSPRIFFVFQLVACISYVNFVLLRVLVLASKMTLTALGETLSVVVVGHHYYVRVWQPAMLDRPFHGTFFYYFCYAWLFSAFAFNRVQEFAPLKQLRGPRLPPLMWLRVLFARFTAKGVPDGDIESRHFVDTELDEDNHRR